jgi:outer membrane protein TolC
MLPTIAVAEEYGEALSIQAALDLAYKNNPNLRLAELNVKKSQLLRDDAFEALEYFPTAGLVTNAFDQVFNAYQQTEIGLATAKRAEQSAQDQITKEVIETYSEAVKNYNNLNYLEMNLKHTKNLQRVSSVAHTAGSISSYEFDNIIVGTGQLEESVRAAQLNYESSIAALRSLLGQHPNWAPVLTSEALITDYERGDLSAEILKGSSESAAVWSQKALLDIEKSKENWVLLGVSSEMKDINLKTAEQNYADAQRTSRVLIEQLYYGIDAVEGQIKIAEMAYKKAVKDEEIARLKYDLGIIPKLSLIPGAESLDSPLLATDKAKTDLSNLKLQLAKLKAQYAFLTGAKAFSTTDWSTPVTDELKQ